MHLRRRPNLPLAAAAVLLLPSLLGLAPPSRAQTSSNPEVAALMQIRSGFTDADAVLPDWNSTAASPCSWTGVKCLGARVASL